MIIVWISLFILSSYVSISIILIKIANYFEICGESSMDYLQLPKIFSNDLVPDESNAVQVGLALVL